MGRSELGQGSLGQTAKQQPASGPTLVQVDVHVLDAHHGERGGLGVQGQLRIHAVHQVATTSVVTSIYPGTAI